MDILLLSFNILGLGYLCGCVFCCYIAVFNHD